MPTAAFPWTALRRPLLAALMTAALGAALMVAALGAARPATAQTAAQAAAQAAAPSGGEPPATAPVWLSTLYKGLSYEAITGYLDLSAMAAHPPAWVSRGYLGVDTATSLATFYAHELAWSAFGPAPGSESVAAVGMGKAITFRILDVARSFAVALAFTGDPLTASGVATAHVVTDTSVYLLNEYGWTLFGPQPPVAAPPAPATVAAR
ncbi:DUF2061 domain-containing protein [Azospirillum sp. ST 5-10]|uniref:DUF2061 domain-containing protein n=1 Tax=unclassified Azospirillum TaxID=2630922 RepID=UPI003F4A1D5E